MNIAATEAEATTPPLMDPLEYREYIVLLGRVFKTLHTYYAQAEQHTPEEESMLLYARKFLRTVKALELKNRWSPLWRARPGVEIAASGFPDCYGIMQLSSDLSSRNERLPKFASSDELKQRILDQTIADALQSDMETEKLENLLWQLAERSYLEMLDLRRLFFAFIPGKVFPAPADFKAKEGREAYYVSWACYDAATHQPYAYLMLFEHEAHAEKLTQDSPELVKLLEILQAVAGRAPENLMGIAVRLDESLSNLYPKVLKRISIGPLYAPLLAFQGVTAPAADSFSARVAPLFEEARLGRDDYVVLFTTETVIASSEMTQTSLLPFKQKKSRQIFYVPKDDRVLMRRGATVLHRYAIMPHDLRQHLSPANLAIVPELAGSIEYLTYNPEDEKGIQHVG